MTFFLLSALGGNSEVFCFPLQVFSLWWRTGECGGYEPPLRSGGEDKHPQMPLVLGWWSHVLFDLSSYKPKFRCHHVSFRFTVPLSGVFWWATKILLKFLISQIHVFHQTFKGSAGRPMADRRKKKYFLLNRGWERRY